MASKTKVKATKVKPVKESAGKPATRKGTATAKAVPAPAKKPGGKK